MPGFHFQRQGKDEESKSHGFVLIFTDQKIKFYCIRVNPWLFVFFIFSVCSMKNFKIGNENRGPI